MIPENTDKGREYLEKAAELKDPDALYALGAELHMNEKTELKGEAMLIKSANLGHADAAYHLAMLLRERGMIFLLVLR